MSQPFGQERAVANATGATANPDLDSNTTFDDRVRLKLYSSFFGTDQLEVRLNAGNIISNVGAAATATNNLTGETLVHWTWRLSWVVPQIGTSVGTYAFPGQDRIGEDGKVFVFRADYYAGQLQEAADFRDKVMLPFPYLQVNFRMHGGTSGGPIIANGRVIGVNCSEYAPTGQEAALAFGTQIRCLRDAFLDDVIPLGQETTRRMSFDELVRTGSIAMEAYAPRDESQPLRGSIIRMDMPATAPAPQVGFEIYA